MNKQTNMLKGIWESRKLIWRLGKNDFKSKFSGSYLGIIWAFVQPVVTVLVYWFVFEKGIKATAATGVGNYPYVLWLVAGIVPWFYFADVLNGGTNAFIEYNYLVQKVVFKIEVLPIVKMISAIFVHLFFVAFTILLFTCYGHFPTIYFIQVIYYTLALSVFSLGLCYFTSAIAVFFKDLKQIVGIILQVGVWITPIMWNIDTMSNISPVVVAILKINPLYYIVAGYRDSFINQRWFWESPKLTLLYWAITLVVCLIGVSTFKKLRPHFADVL